MTNQKSTGTTNTASHSSLEDKSNNLSLEEKAQQVVEIFRSDKSQEEKSEQVWEILKNV